MLLWHKHKHCQLYFHLGTIKPLNFLQKISEDCGLEKLSMGMSGDFEKAISFGATHIRVGSAIFGDRVKFQAQ